MHVVTGVFMCGACFCMGAYKRNHVVVIKIGACIHECFFFCVAQEGTCFLASAMPIVIQAHISY